MKHDIHDKDVGGGNETGPGWFHQVPDVFVLAALGKMF